MVRKTVTFVLSCWACSASLVLAVGIDPTKLPGVVLDDTEAEFVGEWSSSQKISPYIGEGYRFCGGGEADRKVTFRPRVVEAGHYEVLIAYTSSGNRSDKVPVIIHAADGSHTVTINQKQRPTFQHGFESLGEFSLEAGETVIEINPAQATSGPVIIDAVQILTPTEFAEVKKNQPPTPPMLVIGNKPDKTKPVANTPTAKPEKKTEAVFEPAPAFVRRLSEKKRTALTEEQLDTALAKHVENLLSTELCTDEAFLRRLAFDLLGRQPKVEELTAFLQNSASDKRQQLVDQFLASPEFGQNWGPSSNGWHKNLTMARIGMKSLTKS
jgi:Protein of unknown function (DUF1549)